MDGSTAPDLQGAQTKECTSCGQAVERDLLACPKCGGGRFVVGKTHATSNAQVSRAASLTGRMESQNEVEKPVIGMQIPWKTIEGDVFRVTHFTPFAVVEGDKVASPPPVPMPYCVLTVESPIINQPAKMPVNHREEFRNFWELQYFIADAERELLVSYLPYRGFLGPLVRIGAPRLHLRITPKGELERYYADDSHWRKPSAREVLFYSHRWCQFCNARIYTFSVRCLKCKRVVGDWVF